MGCVPSKTKRWPSTLRLIPREPLQEMVCIPDEEVGYPPARADASPKRFIYNAQDNRDIYLHALRAPKSIENSWEDLVHYLTSKYRTDMMKVRSIFSWLGTQNIEKESLSGVRIPTNMDDLTPRGYKKIIKEREGSYAALFALLCRKAGLKCVVINGISKGFGYEVGDRQVTHLRDRWNAVFIDGWRLIHPLWAYKCVFSFKRGRWVPQQEDVHAPLDDTSATDEELLHDFNEYYFLVEPTELITACLPDKEKWQMVPSPMTLDKWISIPHLQKRFHMEGFRMVGDVKATMEAQNGVCSLAIQAPKDKPNDYQLAYDFFYNHVATRLHIENTIQLKPYVLMARDCRDKKWTVELRLPVAGTYKITLYGGPSDRSILPWICDIAVECKKIAKDVRPYPACPFIGFGPMSMTEKLGLTDPSHSNGMLFLKPRQVIHITFKLQKSVDVKAKLIGSDLCERPHDWFSCTINNPSKVNILDVMVKLHEEGEYALKLYSRSKDAGKGDWRNVCNYYLSTDPPRGGGHAVQDKGYKVQYKTANELNARRTLGEAERGTDLPGLRRAIQEFESQGLYETDGIYTRATEKLEYMELALELRETINRRNLELLNKAIQNAEKSSHAANLQKYIRQAYTEREALSRASVNTSYEPEILEMKQTTIAEMTSYANPIPVIHDVLVATLLLLGYNKHALSSWDAVKACMRRTGKDSVIRKVADADGNSIPLSLLPDVSYVTTKYDEPTVRAASAGAATFYCWAKSICDDMEKRKATEDRKRELEEKKMAKLAKKHKSPLPVQPEATLQQAETEVTEEKLRRSVSEDRNSRGPKKRSPTHE